MNNPRRRAFLASAAALGVSACVARPASAPSPLTWSERRDLYPEGVASGDPLPDSVILWTRRPFEQVARAQLTVEVATDETFRRVVATTRATVLAESDWTCRVLVGRLAPRTVYWYRFIDDAGNGSRIGRTITAPRGDDPRSVRFAFVSCQSVNEGAQNAWRRMIWEDRRAPASERLDFVVHLGDFIYEVVEYPDEVAHRYGRTIREVCRIPDSRKIGNFHVPTTLEGYRAVYRGHIADPDIQDARAWFPFVCIGDNHEFSWQGWQSTIKYNGKSEPAQPLRVAANQAWWEYIPSRVAKSSGPGLERFDPPKVIVAPIERIDADGFGDEPNNRAAVGSMTAYRSLRFGRHVELILTDMHSYAMEDPTSRSETDPLDQTVFPFLFPRESMEVLDAGRAYADGKPPETVSFGEASIPNFRRSEPPVTLLGKEQKAWFKQTLASSQATWKVWGASNGTLDHRVDPQNLPEGIAKTKWPGAGYACFGGGDLSGTYHERAELYDFIRDRRIEGFVTVSGDRHSFWAGYAAKDLPPRAFESVGVTFITGSISAPGFAESLEQGLKSHPLRPLYSVQRADGKHEATVNLTLKRGVRSALEYARTGDIDAARKLTNPDNAPHLEFIDMGGHGYSVVTASSATITTEFVCIPRPITRATTDDGGPIRYRVRHVARRWKSGEAPKLVREVVEGDVDIMV
jgi:alkaline phosphatase D